MTKIDKLLLDIYTLGFNDELNNEYNQELTDNFANIISAYKLGIVHAVVGDDLSAIDRLDSEEILEVIYKKQYD